MLVEGHAEVEAAGNLVARLSREIGVLFPWSNPIRWKNLHLREGIRKGAEYIRAKGDAAALLILRDEDDECPRTKGPEASTWLTRLGLPFPSTVVLLHPEYEVLFLPCLEGMAGKELDGRPGIIAGTTWQEPSWEAHRGVKEWLTRHFPENRCYKPMLDQLPMTRMIDIPALRAAGVPCFGTLERGLQFLAQDPPGGAVYPYARLETTAIPMCCWARVGAGGCNRGSESSVQGVRQARIQDIRETPL